MNNLKKAKEILTQEFNILEYKETLDLDDWDDYHNYILSLVGKQK